MTVYALSSLFVIYVLSSIFIPNELIAYDNIISLGLWMLPGKSLSWIDVFRKEVYWNGTLTK